LGAKGRGKVGQGVVSVRWMRRDHSMTDARPERSLGRLAANVRNLRIAVTCVLSVSSDSFRCSIY